MKFQWTDERDEQLRELRANGWSFSAIAKEVGCTRNAAIGKARRLGLGPPQVTVDVGEKRIDPFAHLPDVICPLCKKFVRPGGRHALRCPSLNPPPFEKRLIQAAKEAVAFAAGDMVTLLDLQPHHCRYPFDNGLFCGKPRVRKAYCEYHAGLCYLSSGWGVL